MENGDTSYWLIVGAHFGNEKGEGGHTTGEFDYKLWVNIDLSHPMSNWLAHLNLCKI